MSDPGKSKESQQLFYSFPNGKNGKPDFGNVVEGKFLLVDGLPVKDPFYSAKGADTSERRHLYSRLNADGTIDRSSEFDNSGNHLVVNNDFNLAEDKNFITKANKRWGLFKLLRMFAAFSDYGQEDLQRGEIWRSGG